MKQDEKQKKIIFNGVFLILVFALTIYGFFHGEDLSSSGGFFFSCITPSASGGQPMQIYYMKKEKISIPVSTVILMIVTITYKLVLVVIGIGVAVFGRGFLHTYLERILPVFYLGLALNIFCVTFMMILVFHPLFAKAIMVKGLKVLERLVTWFVYQSFGLHGTGFWEILFLQAVISVSVDMLPLPGMVLSRGLGYYGDQGLPITSMSVILPLLFVASMILSGYKWFVVLLHITMLAVGLLFILDFKFRKPTNRELVILVAVVAVAVLFVLFYNEGWWRFSYIYKTSLERGGTL